ncbi:hypothetical protein L9F63_023153, partial [Diploptera punctata]
IFLNVTCFSCLVILPMFIYLLDILYMISLSASFNLFIYIFQRCSYLQILFFFHFHIWIFGSMKLTNLLNFVLRCSLVFDMVPNYVIRITVDVYNIPLLNRIL